jgi:lipopolysaccharide biosynthesis glycosyltransferase
MIANDLKGDAPFHVNAKKSYFNTGILVLDLEVIRSNALFQKALKLLSNHPEFCASHDQSALNYVINGDFELLDESYNLQNVRVHLGPAETLKILSDRSVNIHFITQKTKPWITYSPYPSETMFRILLDYVYPNWKSSDYNRNARFLRCRFFFAPLLPAFFKARGFIKRLLGKRSSLDDNASLNWKIIADDLRFLRNSAANLKVLFSGWKKQIEFRLVEK